jgi:UDP-2,3-diacylglucosamine pyrophosphatase LpxH
MIVSDLHVDTWDERLYGQGARRKKKLDHWADFLAFCEQASVDEVIIDGDLMDAPPYEGNVSFTSEIAREAVRLLLDYASKHSVTYVFGNHDIGISGIRCDRGKTPLGLTDMCLVYPRYAVQTDPITDANKATASTVLIQHGHLYDPAMVLYVSDLTVRTYILSGGQAYQWGMQRRNLETGARLKDPGVGTPAAVNLAMQPESNIYYAIRDAAKAAPPTKRDLERARRWIDHMKDDVVKKVGGEVKSYIWREAAEDIFKDYAAGRGKNDSRRVIYCVMGHTHVPDKHEMDVDGRHCIYLNSGTWTGAGAAEEDRAYATYLDLRDDGTVWIQDWIRNPHLVI